MRNNLNALTECRSNRRAAILASLVRYIRPEAPVHVVDPGKPDTGWIRNETKFHRVNSAVGLPRLAEELIRNY